MSGWNIHLKADDARSYDHLWFWTDETRPFSRARRRVKDARDAIRLGQQSTVDDGEAGADTQSLDSAREDHRLGQEGERVQVAQEDASQQYEAQLAAGCLRPPNIQDQTYQYSHNTINIEQNWPLLKT